MAAHGEKPMAVDTVLSAVVIGGHMRPSGRPAAAVVGIIVV
jgi:hypothetical protein